MTTDIQPLTCNAFIGKRAGTYGFEFVTCTQVVGLRGFWAVTERWENTDHYVSYCAIEGHEANVRRRFAPDPALNGIPADPPRPVFLHEDATFYEPESADPISFAKWEAARHGR